MNDTSTFKRKVRKDLRKVRKGLDALNFAHLADCFFAFFAVSGSNF